MPRSLRRQSCVIPPHVTRAKLPFCLHGTRGGSVANRAFCAGAWLPAPMLLPMKEVL
jgi:hypothetical protein